jgi:hypothetical protein
MFNRHLSVLVRAIRGLRFGPRFTGGPSNKGYQKSTACYQDVR